MALAISLEILATIGGAKRARRNIFRVHAAHVADDVIGNALEREIDATT